MPYKVMIDPGHGHTNVNQGAFGYYEWFTVWLISQELKKELERNGIYVEYTTTPFESLGVVYRGQRAKGFDLFISEHTNASDNPDVRGVSTYRSLLLPGNASTAELIASRVSSLMGTRNLGAKTRRSTNYPTRQDYYGVIYGAAQLAKCPHVYLCETGYHTNLQDVSFLINANNLKKIALEQAAVICSILSVAQTPPPQGGNTMAELVPVKVTVEGNTETLRSFRVDGVTYTETRKLFENMVGGKIVAVNEDFTELVLRLPAPQTIEIIKEVVKEVPIPDPRVAQLQGAVQLIRTMLGL